MSTYTSDEKLEIMGVLTMDTIHLEVKNVNIGATAAKVAYQRGERIQDERLGKVHDYTGKEVVFSEIIIPENALSKLLDSQVFVNELEKAERRKDARTLREITVSLPNELSISENIELAKKYITENFVKLGMCTALAVHEGHNVDPEKNNPHCHILLSTRPICPKTGGFAVKKNRDWNKRANVTLWRESLAAEINEAYKRKGISKEVAHKSNIKRGVDKEAQKYLSRIDYEREKRGEHTPRGDLNREIQARNAERDAAKMKIVEIKRKKRELQQRIQNEIFYEMEMER